MAKEDLPIYQIPDFEAGRIDSAAFYYSRFGSHLQKHRFIQKPHKHDFYIVLLVTAGVGTHAIDFQNYAVTPGSVFFLTPGQVHSWKLSEDAEGHILFFSTEFYSAGFPAKALDRFPFLRSSAHSSNLVLGPGQTAEIDLVFSEIANENATAAWSKKEILRSYTEILLVKLARIYQDAFGLKGAGLPIAHPFRLLESTIETHFSKHRNPSFYADKLSLSLRQLNRLTQESVGKSASQLLLDRVILESKRLLTYSDRPVAEIAATLGFDDPSYFSRLFRKKAGSTPEQFRKSVR